MQLLSGKSSAGADRAQRARLGQINFVNCLPVVHPLATGKLKVDADLHLASPTELNSLFQSDQLDVGAMSSYHYLKHRDKLTLLDGVSISTLKHVGSVLFFLRGNPQSRKPFRVAVPSSSASSVALLRIYLAERFSIVPEIKSVARPDMSDEEMDGVLVIGDRALNYDDLWAKSFERVDLGWWWSSTFSLPMVFGLWAARSHWLSANGKQFALIEGAMNEARDLGLGSLFDEVKEEAVRRTSLSLERIRRYYKEELNFDLSADHKEGLSLFGALSQKHGLL